MEHAGAIGADAFRHEHVAELRAGGIGDHALDVVLHETDGRGEEGGGGAEEDDDPERDRRKLEQRRQPRHHEHAGRHHGGGVNERRHRRRAFHGVRQPGVQQELRRFPHGADEQQDADQRERIHLEAQELHGLADLLRGRGKNGVVVEGAEHGEDGEDAEREAEIADAVDDEGLDGGGVGGRLVVPEADQEIGGEADALPAEKELEEIVGRDQRQHGEGEQREIGEEARPGIVLLHVADRIEMHEAGDRGHHHQHHRRQRVDAERPRGLELAGLDEGEELDPRLLAVDADLVEGEPGEQRGDEDEGAWSPLRWRARRRAGRKSRRRCAPISGRKTIA